MTVPESAEPHDSPLCGAATRSGKPCQRPAGWGTDHLGEGRCKLHGGLTPIKHGRYSKIRRPRIRELLEEQDKDPDPLNLLPDVKLLRALIVDYVERYDEQTEALIAWHASFAGFEDRHSKWRADVAAWLDKFGDFQRKFAEYRAEVEQVQRFYMGGWPDPPPLPKLLSPPSPPHPGEAAGKPRQVVDILSAGKFIANIGALTERMERARQEGTITLAALDSLLVQYGAEVVAAAEETIREDAARTALLDSVERRWQSVRLPDGRDRRGNPGTPPVPAPD